MNSCSAVNIFRAEAEELLEQIEETVLDVQPGSEPGEAVHRLFRAFHTLKGSGAMFGFDALAEFTHHVETVLDCVRAGTVPVSRHLLDLILASKDQIAALLDPAPGGAAASGAQGGALVASLNALLPAAAEGGPVSGTEPAPAPAVPAAVQAWRIRFRPHPGLLASGTNPVLLLDELRALGTCAVQADPSAIPGLEAFEPDRCYLAWEITLATAHELNAVKDIFIFVEEGSDLSFEPLPARKAAAAPDLPAMEVSKVSSQGAMVRVPAERLDRLVSLVGELVMNQSRLTQVAGAAHVPNLTASVEELERLVAELRDNVLGIRMMPIGATFSRYRRLVHDLAAELGKAIDLVTEGAETELDKTVLDQLGDPLVHLIRNSLDHGIEAADKRVSAGKPFRGTIRLVAAHVGAHVVLTIQDDGQGLDAPAIRAKAVEQGLIAPGAVLSASETLDLIFRPGFSTARSVTKVSGRGVGMDVVKRQVEALRGSIQVESVAGQGTKVVLTLPLTLAIIDGLLVELGPDQFIIPMAAVSENVELTRAERRANNGRQTVVVRGELVPYLRLRDLFEIRGAEPELERIVIVTFNQQRLGVGVDRVIGSHQTVIQSLSRFYRGVDLFSGTTIMGDGRVAMICDLAGLLRLSARQAATKSQLEPTNLMQPTRN